MVSPIHLLLFGARTVEWWEDVVKLDKWINLKMNADTAATIVALRPVLEKMFINSIDDPERITEKYPQDAEIIDIVKCLCCFNAGRYGLEGKDMQHANNERLDRDGHRKHCDSRARSPARKTRLGETNADNRYNLEHNRKRPELRQDSSNRSPPSKFRREETDVNSSFDRGYKRTQFESRREIPKHSSSDTNYESRNRDAHRRNNPDSSDRSPPYKSRRGETDAGGSYYRERNRMRPESRKGIVERNSIQNNASDESNRRGNYSDSSTRFCPPDSRRETTNVRGSRDQEARLEIRRPNLSNANYESVDRGNYSDSSNLVPPSKSSLRESNVSDGYNRENNWMRSESREEIPRNSAGNIYYESGDNGDYRKYLPPSSNNSGSNQTYRNFPTPAYTVSPHADYGITPNQTHSSSSDVNPFSFSIAPLPPCIAPANSTVSAPTHVSSSDITYPSSSDVIYSSSSDRTYPSSSDITYSSCDITYPSSSNVTYPTFATPNYPISSPANSSFPRSNYSSLSKSTYSSSVPYNKYRKF